MVFNKNSLKEIFNNVNEKNLSEDGKETHNWLRHFLFEMNKADTEQIDLVDINSLKASVLWDGYADVRLAIESGIIDDYVDNLTENELEAFIQKAINVIDWEGDAFTSADRGNEEIANMISNLAAASA